MTLKTLRDRLVSDPNFRVNYIVDNNPGAVEDKLRAMGFSISGIDDIWEALRELLDQQRTEDLQEALTVPILTDGRDAAELAVVADVSKAQTQAADPDGRLMTKSVQGPWSTGAMGPTSAGGDDDTSDSTSFWNTQAASGLITGMFGLGAGVLSNFGLYQSPTGNESARAAQDEAARKAASRTTTIIVVVSVVILAAVAFFVLKGKK